jgi:O-antigen/teichoic acid export membrane protein
MSRSKRFAHSLLSGYLLVGINIVYTLISVPLTLHFLRQEEFGLWALIMQMVSFNLILIDLGMSGSLGRILIDHKDDKQSSAYGSVIQTGVMVLGAQALLIITLGSILSIWLPALMNVPEKYWSIFRILTISQCIVTGAAYAGRIFGFILQAHQRYDICNYLSMGALGIGLAALWISFEEGLGLYSIVAASSASAAFTVICSALAARQLRLFPEKTAWGRPSRAAFRELFIFGTDLFLVSIGNQLIVASSVIVVSRAMGLKAAAIWAVTTKVFVLAQQLVYRIIDFSAGALSEMMVRSEKERLKARFKDVFILTGSAAAIAVALALCNQAFLKIWTPNLAWNPINNLLMAISFFVYSLTRVPIGFIGLTKQIRGTKFVYFFEGVAFVGLGLLLAPRWGFPCIILSGILTNLLCSGIYGAYRLIHYFGISRREFITNWLVHPVLLFLTSGITALTFWLLERNLNAPTQLILGASIFGSIMLFLFWHIGIPKHLRREASDRLKQVLALKVWKQISWNKNV